MTETIKLTTQSYPPYDILLGHGFEEITLFDNYLLYECRGKYDSST